MGERTHRVLNNGLCLGLIILMGFARESINERYSAEGVAYLMPVFRASFLYILICGDGFWEILAHCHILNSSLSYTKKEEKNIRR